MKLQFNQLRVNLAVYRQELWWGFAPSYDIVSFWPIYFSESIEICIKNVIRYNIQSPFKYLDKEEKHNFKHPIKAPHSACNRKSSRWVCHPKPMTWGNKPEPIFSLRLLCRLGLGHQVSLGERVWGSRKFYEVQTKNGLSLRTS